MASIKQFIERRDNIASIISFVRSKGAATRLEISSGLSLSWACVSDLASLLIERRILTESKKKSGAQQTETVGRTPAYLTLNNEKYFLGVDINDTGISISVLDLCGKKTDYKKWEAELLDDDGELAESVCEKIDVMLKSREGCCGIGVAMQGARSGEDKWIYPVTNRYVQFDPMTVIKNRFSLPVFVRHDPECMLYAVVDNISVDSMTLRVDNDIGVAAMKNGRILEVPLDLGHIYVGERKLKTILNECDASGDYTEIAEELGLASANLAKLLGLKKVFIVGKIIEWIDGVSVPFDRSFRRVSSRIEYVVSNVVDASEGAALVAIAEYPDLDSV